MKTPNHVAWPTGRQMLLLLIVLLPLGCLLWQWSIIPGQVPLHFSRGGPDSFGSKYALIGLALLPVLLYGALPFLYPAATPSARRGIVIGVLIFLSLGVCVLVGGISA